MIAHQSSRKRTSVLHLETLEDRCVPANIVIAGGGGDDVIEIDEPAGTFTVNGVATDIPAPGGGGNHTYAVNTGGGKDTVTIKDGGGDDTYQVRTGDDNDTITVTDAAGDDKYTILTGNATATPTDPAKDTVSVQDGANPNKVQRYLILSGNGNDEITVTDAADNDTYDINTSSGADKVTITDGANAADFEQVYRIRTERDRDTVVIKDGANKDKYDIDLGAHADTLDVTDDTGIDTYLLNGGAPAIAPGDGLTTTDAFVDPDVFVIVGFGPPIPAPPFV